MDPSSRGAFGTSFVATQDATSLTIQATTTNMTMSLSGGTTASSETPKAQVFSFNGEDETVTHPRPANIDAMDQTRMMWSFLTTSTSRASWMGDELIIVTHNMSTVRFPGHTPSDFQAEQTVRLALALDADARLIAERTIIADPLPFDTAIRIDPPSVFKTAYRKAR